MSCYHPLAGFVTGELTKNGKQEIVIKGFYNPPSDPELTPPFFIPCGKCIGCRLDYARTWADRMMLELDHSKKGIFLTLTYNNEHVPQTEISYDGEYCPESGMYTLDRRDLQLFFKRLRKKFPDKELRYYAVGEYGSSTNRPHYHVVLFGIDLGDLSNKKVVDKNKLGHPIYTAREIEEAWSIFKYKKEPVIGNRGKTLKKFKKVPYYDPIGFVSIGELSWQTCAYTARYVQKKIFGGKHLLTDLYGCEPEFSVMSRNPGIGAYYLFDHPDVFDYSRVHVSGYDGDIRLPKYLLDFLDKEFYNGDANPFYDPEKLKKIKEDKQKFSRDKELLDFLQTDLDYITRLENAEVEKLSKVSVLARDRI